MNDTFASKVNGFYNAFTQSAINFTSRWVSEMEHEDIKDYKNAVQSALDLYFTPHNMKAVITKMIGTKTKFGFKVAISYSNESRTYEFAVSAKNNSYSYKRIG